MAEASRVADIAEAAFKLRRAFDLDEFRIVLTLLNFYSTSPNLGQNRGTKQVAIRGLNWRIKLAY